MADFRPFNLAEAQQAGTRNALAQMQTMGAARQVGRTNAIDQLSRQAAQTGEDLPTLLDQAGFQGEANRMRDLTMKRQVAGMTWITKRAPAIRDQKSYQSFLDNAEKLGIMQRGELPQSWNSKTRTIIQSMSGRMNSDLKKITRMVGPGQAQDITNIGGRIEHGPIYDPRKGRTQPTSLQKNVPYLANLLNIPESEAGKILTTGRKKGRAGFRQDAVMRFTSQMYGPEEAVIAADDLTNRVFGKPKKKVDTVPSASVQPGEKVAFNQATGETMVFRNGEWLLIQN